MAVNTSGERTVRTAVSFVAALTLGTTFACVEPHPFDSPLISY